MEDEKDIIAEVVQYSIDFIEKPNKDFNNFAICPFAKKPRQDGLINYQVLAFSISDPIDERVIKLIDEFDAQTHFQSIFVIHPDKTLSLNGLKAFTNKIQDLIRLRGLIIFRGHPLDDFKIGEEYTRQEPYPGFQILRESLILKTRIL